MKKLKYINDDQFIEAAAVLIIKEHLEWSGSAESMPSRGCGNVLSEIGSAYLEALFENEGEWDVLSDEDRAAFERGDIDALDAHQQAVEKKAMELYEKARELADKKWAAAMTLLGI